MSWTHLCHLLLMPPGNSNLQISSLSEELAKKTDDASRQQEEITHLLSQIVDLQKKAKLVWKQHLRQSNRNKSIMYECFNAWIAGYFANSFIYFFFNIYSMLLRTRSWRSTWVQRRTPRGNSLLRWENSEPANRDFTIIEFSIGSFQLLEQTNLHKTLFLQHLCVCACVRCARRNKSMKGTILKPSVNYEHVNSSYSHINQL